MNVERLFVVTRTLNPDDDMFTLVGPFMAIGRRIDDDHMAWVQLEDGTEHPVPNSIGFSTGIHAA